MELAARMRPAKDVGGDFYDFFRIDNDRIGVVIADVSGKGIPAAIFMAVSRTLIRTVGLQGITPGECMTKSNELLSKESIDCMFVTVFYAIYNISTGEFVYCNAGHNSPAILKSNGKVEMLPVSKNCMVGAVEGVTYSNTQARLEIGDTLLMYTDGVNEAMNEAFEEYGDERMMRLLATQSGNDCQTIIDQQLADVKAFAGNAAQSDDITLMALKRKA